MTTQTSPTMSAAPLASSDKALIILSHLSALFGVGFVLPLVVWLVKRHDPDSVAAHAAEALNFHLSLLIYTVCLIPLIFVVVGVPLMILLAVGGIVLAIIAALKASNGEFYRYPLTIRFVK